MPTLDPERIPLLASGAAMLGLAILVVAVDVEKRVNRAFAAILALRGASLVAAQPDLGARANLALAALVPYLVLPLLPLGLYFASHHPRRRGPFGRPGGGWVALGIAAALDLAYLAWHEGYHGLALGVAGNPAMQARSGVLFTSFGPLVLLGMASYPLFALLGFLFARDYALQPGPRRVPHLLVAAGFLVNGLFDGVRQAISLASILAQPEGFPWLPWGWAVAAVPALSLLPSAAALAVLARHPAAQGLARRMERRVLAFSGLAVASAMLPWLLGLGGAFFGDGPSLLLLGAWRLSLPLLVTYALLRYSLFDMDAKARAVVTWSAVTAAFAATYFIASTLVEGLVQERAGPWAAFAAAVLLSVAVRPLSGLGHRMGAFLLPEAAPGRSGDALHLYREQCILLHGDGNLTAKERACLEKLRRSLGLSAAQARAIERKVAAPPLRHLRAAALRPAAARPARP